MTSFGTGGVKFVGICRTFRVLFLVSNFRYLGTGQQNASGGSGKAAKPVGLDRLLAPGSGHSGDFLAARCAVAAGDQNADPVFQARPGKVEKVPAPAESSHWDGLRRVIRENGGCGVIVRGEEGRMLCRRLGRELAEAAHLQGGWIGAGA